MGWLAPFFSTYLSPLKVVFNFVWILLLGLGTALVVFGIPRGVFYIIQRVNNKKAIANLSEEMENDYDDEDWDDED